MATLTRGGTPAGLTLAFDSRRAGQCIAAGEFSEVARAMRVGVTYANVHSTQYPGGEIRAQLTSRHKR